MKRDHGHKTGKSKKRHAEDNSDQPGQPTTVYGRAKPRLKATKPFEPQLKPADVPIRSDANSSSCKKRAVKSSKGLAPSSAKEKKSKNGAPKLPNQDPRYNKKELDAALEVIKKVMKMDVAEPFNVPLNPVELGIPDYFDVIDTPMDFGTVCKNLESGTKYINSESVYKDVRYIWKNCYKYYDKRDYIAVLMREVKENFIKYWTESGLYTDKPKRRNGVNGNNGTDHRFVGLGSKEITTGATSSESSTPPSFQDECDTPIRENSRLIHITQENNEVSAKIAESKTSLAELSTKLVELATQIEDLKKFMVEMRAGRLPESLSGC